MGFIEKEVDDVERFNEIITVMAEEGLGALLDELDLAHKLPLSKRFRRKKEPGPERLRETFERLGPTFIKFGQLLAERPDIVPKEYIHELEKLQDDVPGFDPEKAKEIVDEEIGLENFKDFHNEPMAAASIAQVHEAQLKNGEEVVVKIRRPGIKEEIEEDLDILEFLAHRASNHSKTFSDIQLTKSVKEFSQWTRQELNLKKEARNGEILKENMSDEEKIKIPEMHTELTTEKVLVMEKIEGVKINDVEALKEMSIDTKKLSETAIRAGLKQVLRDGFFHADPHQSNFIVQEDSTLVLIDFGMMGNLSQNQRKDLGLLMLHILREDMEKAMNDLKRIGTVQEDADLEHIKSQLEEKTSLLKNSSIGEVSFTEQIIELAVDASRNGIVMPQSLILAAKATVAVEGIGMTICPEYRVEDHFKDTIRDILMEEFRPEKLIEEFSLDMIENRDLITELPSKINQLAERKETEIKIENQKKDNQAVIAALVLSSAFLISQGKEILNIIGLFELGYAAFLFHKEH